MAQIRALNSAWRGERLRLMFLAPKKTLASSFWVYYHPTLEKMSESFHEPSMKHLGASMSTNAGIEIVE